MKTINVYSTNRDFEPEHDGSITDPYTYQEFLELYNNPADHSRWRGGFVEDYGFIPRNIRITAGKIIVLNGLYEDMTSFPEYLYEDLYPLNFNTPITYETTEVTEGYITTMTCAVQASITAYLLSINVKLIAMPFDNPFISIFGVYILKEIGGHITPIPMDEADSLTNCEFDGSAKVNLPLDGDVNIYIAILYDFDYERVGADTISATSVLAIVPVNIKR